MCACVHASARDCPTRANLCVIWRAQNAGHYGSRLHSARIAYCARNTSARRAYAPCQKSAPLLAILALCSGSALLAARSLAHVSEVLYSKTRLHSPNVYYFCFSLGVGSPRTLQQSSHLTQLSSTTASLIEGRRTRRQKRITQKQFVFIHIYIKLSN